MRLLINYNGAQHLINWCLYLEMMIGIHFRTEWFTYGLGGFIIISFVIFVIRIFIENLFKSISTILVADISSFIVVGYIITIIIGILMDLYDQRRLSEDTWMETMVDKIRYSRPKKLRKNDFEKKPHEVDIERGKVFVSNLVPSRSRNRIENLFIDIDMSSFHFIKLYIVIPFLLALIILLISLQPLEYTAEFMIDLLLRAVFLALFGLIIYLPILKLLNKTYSSKCKIIGGNNAIFKMVLYGKTMTYNFQGKYLMPETSLYPVYNQSSLIFHRMDGTISAEINFKKLGFRIFQIDALLNYIYSYGILYENPR